MKRTYFSFDVESIGLWGPDFAVGFVVVDETGKELESGLYGYDYNDFVEELLSRNLNIFNRWAFTEDDLAWVRKNVKLPLGWNNCSSPRDLGERFYETWQRCKAQYENLTIISDCPLPVEFNFLLSVLAQAEDRTMEGTPYPLIDCASVLFAHGYDPIGTYKRLPNELPAHDPLNDARQSVRIMLAVLNGEKID